MRMKVYHAPTTYPGTHCDYPSQRVITFLVQYFATALVTEYLLAILPHQTN
jgi:hypothetical protein